MVWGMSSGLAAMIVALFAIALFFEIAYLLMFALTIRGGRFRFWPPPSPRSWQFFLAWFLALIVAVFSVFLGFLDFDSFLLPRFWIRLWFALVLILPANILGLWVEVVFPFQATIGLGDRLIIAGPYRYTRNPQYICDSLFALAYMLLVNSWMVCILGILGIGLNLLAPFTEEPWLEERFGEEYRQYRARVPRFMPKGVLNKRV
jgi:protein-S-isoprenylcysteine O-methyltransferase Ste14